MRSLGNVLALAPVLLTFRVRENSCTLIASSRSRAGIVGGNFRRVLGRLGGDGSVVEGFECGAQFFAEAGEEAAFLVDDEEAGAAVAHDADGTLVEVEREGGRPDRASGGDVAGGVRQEGEEAVADFADVEALGNVGGETEVFADREDAALDAGERAGEIGDALEGEVFVSVENGAEGRGRGEGVGGGGDGWLGFRRRGGNFLLLDGGGDGLR